MAMVVVMLLYVLIGTQPYQHEAILDPVTGVAPVSPINRYFWLLMLAASLPVLWFKRQGLAQLCLRVWPLLALYVWFVLSTTWALDPGASHRRIFLYIVDLAICLAIRLGAPDGTKLHSALATACGIVVLIDLGSWIFAPGVSMTDLGLAAIHTHKNTLGAVMLLSALVIGPYALGRNSRGGKLVWGALWVACMALLVASRSKTSLAITLASLAFIPPLLLVLRMRAIGLWAAGLLALGLVSSLIFGWLAYCYLRGADPLGPLAHLTFTQRTDVWKFSLQEWAKRPLGGVGFGSFWDVDPGVQPSLQTDLWFAKPDAYTNKSHNGYIDLLVTTGVVGLIGALAVFFRWAIGGLALLRAALGARSEELAFAVTCGVFPLMFFVHNWMESTYFTANTIFGLMILLFGVYIDAARGPVKAARSL